MIKPLALAIQQNFIAHLGLFAQYDKSIESVHKADFFRTDGNVNAGALNICVPLTDTPEPLAFSQTLAYFSQKRRPAVIWLWDHLTAWQEFLSQNRVNLLAVNTGMCALIDELTINTKLPPGLKIETVTTPQQVMHFGDMVSQAFGKPCEAPEVMRYYERLSHTGFYNDKRIKMFVGYYHNKPVCSGTRMIAGDTAGIYSIAAPGRVRGKGFGSAMFHHILQNIKTCHKGLCTLKASPMGINIYAKAGFKPVCDVFIYDNRDLLDKP